MPVPHHPRARDFFVYQFKAGGYPFYVGIGRDKRASDRLRYVRSLMVSKNAAKLAKKSLSVRVLALLLKHDVDISLTCSRIPMNRGQALKRERQTIDRLIKAGFLLTNFQHNPHRSKDAAAAARAIMTGKRLKD